MYDTESVKWAMSYKTRGNNLTAATDALMDGNLCEPLTRQSPTDSALVTAFRTRNLS